VRAIATVAGARVPGQVAIRELYVPLEWAFELYAQTIAAVRLSIAIDDSRVLRKLTHQRGNQRYFTELPASFGEHSSTVGTDIFRNSAFANPRLIQVREVDLNWQWLAPLNSRIETFQTTPVLSPASSATRT
jgi:hypothetical protein